MAVNPIQFLVAQNASITDGTKTITISGNVDCSRVFSGTAVFLGGADNPAEAVAGTAPDGSGNSTITLRNNWSQGDVINQQLVSFNTNEGLAEAISNVREIVSNVSAIEDLATQGLIKRINDNVYEVVNISTVGESLITASDASSQRSVLGLGSAATKNVGTSSGDVMQVGAFGIGSLAPTVSDAHVELESGIYSGAGSTAINFPASMGYGVFFNAVRANNNAVNGRVYIGDISGVATAYIGFSNDNGQTFNHQELYHSGNSVNPLDYGIGVTGQTPSVPNLNTHQETGLFRVADSNTTGLPEVFLGTMLQNNRDSARRNQIIHNELEMFFRGENNVGFADWNRVYHSGNSVNPKDYGIGAINITGEVDLNGEVFTREGATVISPLVGDVINKPYDLFTTSRYIVTFDGGISNGVQRITNRVSGATWQRSVNGGVFSDWNEIYHSGNTNFNEFGGGTIGDIIMSEGIVDSTSTALFYVQLHGTSDPVSISVSGTFKVSNKRTGASLGTTTSLVLIGTSSKNVALIRAQSLAGLTVGDLVRLDLETTGAKITVNF